MRIDRIKLISEMARKNISQTDLAARCNCSRETINLACRGLRCSDRTAEAIADVLEIPLKELL